MVAAERSRILVVEDDSPTRQMLTQFLTDEGFEVAVAQDGSHALRVAAASHPDVVVLDVGLPVLDGSGFARRLRTRLRAGTPPIIVISGQPYGRAMADQIGAVAFYAKPVDLRSFVEYLHALADRQSEQVAEEQESSEEP